MQLLVASLLPAVASLGPTQAPAASQSTQTASSRWWGGCKKLQQGAQPSSLLAAVAHTPQGGWWGRGRGCTATRRTRPLAAPPPSTKRCGCTCHWLRGPWCSCLQPWPLGSHVPAAAVGGGAFRAFTGTVMGLPAAAWSQPWPPGSPALAAAIGKGLFQPNATDIGLLGARAGCRQQQQQWALLQPHKATGSSRE